MDNQQAAIAPETSQGAENVVMELTPGEADLIKYFRLRDQAERFLVYGSAEASATLNIWRMSAPDKLK